MQAVQDHNFVSEYSSSWRSSADAMVLGDIFEKGISVAVWTRPEEPLISQYYDDVFKSLGLGIRGVFSLTLLKEAEANGEKLNGTKKMLFDVYLELGNDIAAETYLNQIKDTW